MLAGGLPKGAQCRELNNAPELIVSTPGRLIDMLEGGFTSLQNVKYLVLDEADRMLDMGFGPQIQRILSSMGEHQTLMFSATWPREVQSIARTYMRDYVHVTVGSLELAANLNITQHVDFMEPHEKRQKCIARLVGAHQLRPRAGSSSTSRNSVARPTSA
jgi:ATP-dependent RNA helicase DDX5/DBP2